jgi:CheY-like chemotaxis protein
MRILIVDDEVDLRELLREAFEDEGYVVDVAIDGCEALEQLESDQLPCAMILDIVMPRIDGVEVWHTMQRDPRLASIPVVITTSDPSRAPQGALIMRKPVDLELLLSTVSMFCRKSADRRS